MEGGYWTTIKNYLSPRESLKPPGVFPTVHPNFLEYSATPSLKVTWLGHSTILVYVDNITLLLDPVFDDRVSVLVGSTERFQPALISREDLPSIDAVIISHDHYDHLEKNTIDFLSPEGTLFFVPLGVGAHLEQWLVPDSQIIELDWWESKKFRALELICFPARHFSGRTLLAVDHTLWASWAIIGSKKRVYFGGDTGFTGQFEQIGDRYGPFDLTLLPIGAYGDSWPDIHLNPEEAVSAHLALKGKLLIPIHWGTFDLALHPWDEPIVRFVQAASVQQIEIATPHLGGTIILDAVSIPEYWWRIAR